MGSPNPRLNRSTASIRRYRAGDETAIAEVFDSSVREVATAAYSKQQTVTWADHGPSPSDFERQATDGRLFVVAVDADQAIVAYGDLEANGHIDHLYCAPQAAGTGIGSLLYESIEAHARQHKFPRLYVEASEQARRLFERHGFRVDHRNDLDLAGVAIHNFTMSKVLVEEAT